MKKRWTMASVVLLALCIGSFTTQHAQNTTTGSQDSEHAKRSLAINVLRAINTAEADYHGKHRMFASWEVLVASEEFTKIGVKWAAKSEQQLSSVRFSTGPEILPGWKLRLHLTADGNGYDVLLEDAADKACGYAAITDERGIIRQGKTIDCQI